MDPKNVLIAKTTRGMSCASSWKESRSKRGELEQLLQAIWTVDRLDCIRLIFNIRDCRSPYGRGEKMLFYACVWWLMHKDLELTQRIMEYIPFYGCWKDLLIIFCGTPLESAMLKLWAKQLHRDRVLLDINRWDLIDLSAAKYAPNERSVFDRKYNVVKKLCDILGTNAATYRKYYYRPLRTAWAEPIGVKIVETQMCAQEWNEIDVNHVPVGAKKLYFETFKRHGLEPPLIFQTDPREIVRNFTQGCSTGCSIPNPSNFDSNEFWAAHVARMRDTRKGVVCIPICNVSCSMFHDLSGYKPIDGALALTLSLALTESPESPLYRKWLNFSQNPCLNELQGQTLGDVLSHMNWNNCESKLNLLKCLNLVADQVQRFTTVRFVICSNTNFNESVGEFVDWHELNCIAQEARITCEVVFLNLAAPPNAPSNHLGKDNVILLSGCG